MSNYIIAGGGVAGVTAAREILRLDAQASIEIYCHEGTPYYYRPRLWEYIAGRISADDTIFRPSAWYQEQGIRLHLNRPISKIDSKNHQIQLKTGETKDYDRLLIAAGSSSFVPPVTGVDLSGVFALRTLQDAMDIVAYSQHAQQVVVIGGGLLGLETAKALADRGLQVTVIEFFPYLLPRQLDPEGAKVLTHFLEKQGLKIVTNEATQTINQVDNRLQITLKSGSQIETDMIVFSTGIRSNLAPWTSCEIAANRGLIVDQYMQTNQPDIFAAGDVAEFDGVVYGIIPAATEQAKIAAANMVTPNSLAYEGTLPSTKLKVAGMEFSSIGEATAEGEGFTVLSETDSGQESYDRIVLKDGVIVGAIVLGNMKRLSALKKLIAEKTDVSAVQEQLLDPAFDLKSLL